MPSPQQWLKITFRCPQQITESVSDLMGVISGAGVDIHPLEKTGQNEITGFFALDADAAAAVQDEVCRELEILFSLYNLVLPEPKTEIIDDQDWATSWQKYFSPFEIIPGLVIKPTWEDFIPVGNQMVVEMDPGMAFGTGQHESTKLALSIISSCFRVNNTVKLEKVLDVGTGTGILAMSTALFGADSIMAIDNDPEAVHIARKNIHNNHLEKKIDAAETPLTDLKDPFDLICANIVHDVLVAMAPDFKRLASPNGHIVLSGILAGDQEKNIKNVFQAFGMKFVRAEYDGEWAAILLQA